MSDVLAKEAVVPKELYGERVDVVLAKLFPEHSRSQLTQWLKQGAITLDREPSKPKDKVQGGEFVKLKVTLETAEHPLAEDIPLNIVYEDEHLLVINKPSGLIVHPGAGNPQHTLVNALLHYNSSLQSLPRAGIIHRLDKDTTGLLLVAKSLPSHTALVRMMQEREIHRRYITLVYGNVISGKRVETFYGRHPHNRLKMAVSQTGKEAITDFFVKARYQQFTLLEVELLTGRTHQIRVHMAYVNHPVVGDPLYAGRTRFPQGISPQLREQLQKFKRQALHAYGLEFAHPFTEDILTLSAALPDDFQSLLKVIETDE
jgi:23S rRNA pseudouridine1911/1915/1917 synthase